MLKFLTVAALTLTAKSQNGPTIRLRMEQSLEDCVRLSES